MQLRNDQQQCEHCGFDDRPNEIHQLPMGVVLKERYFIGKALGQGGFGITYIAWDSHDKAPVAIKEFFPSGAVQRASQTGLNVTSYRDATKSFTNNKARFSKEATSLLQMKGLPEVVQVKDFFEEYNTAYIVMEYVDGITLKNYVKQLGRPLRPDEVISMLKPLVRALRDVHQLHLLHRDISPDNIMLAKDGGIKLIDFGTVRYMDDTNLSKSTEAILKPGFAPMEQYQNRGKLGPWTDVYALCATMYFCMTGKVPLDAPSRLDEPDLQLDEIPGIDQQIRNALEKGMEVRISQRLADMEELYEALYGQAEATQAPFDVPQPAEEPVPQVIQEPETKTPPRKQKRSAAPLMVALFLVSGLIIGLLVFITFSDTKFDSTLWTTLVTGGTTHGRVDNGWYLDGSDYYYYKDGKMVTGWQTIDGRKYYFREDGVSVRGQEYEINGIYYQFAPNGLPTIMRYPTRETTVSKKPFYFESSQGDIREVYYLEFSPVHNCVGVTLNLAVSDIEYGKAEGTWVVCLRVNGQWIRYQDFEVNNNQGSVKLTLSEPVRFDAITAYRKTGGNFRGKCTYEMRDIKIKYN